jgi:hypothetical protein
MLGVLRPIFRPRCTSFYPTKEARYDYLAVRAFNVEVSNIADSVTNVQLGKVRFQWWREAIQSMSSVSCVEVRKQIVHN